MENALLPCKSLSKIIWVTVLDCFPDAVSFARQRQLKSEGFLLAHSSRVQPIVAESVCFRSTDHECSLSRPGA